MSEIQREYGPRDVVWAPLTFLRSQKPLRERSTYRDAAYETEGKERPLLVIKEPDAQGGQNTLAFATTKPQGEVIADFFKDPRGEPWPFFQSQGFDATCYLNISASHYYDRLRTVVRKGKRSLVAVSLFNEIIKQHGFRYLGMKT